MYDIRQFRPTLYLVLLLGLLGYGIALESPAHFVLGALLTMLNYVLTRSDGWHPIPRPVASGLALLAGFWSGLGLLRNTMTPLMAISQWLFVLLLLTLWTRRENRTYGQLLVMSLVLMVAGAINTASIWYGGVLILYLLLSMYCGLLFHLKVDTEAAIKLYSVPKERVNAQSLKHDQTHFARSMRRLTTLISTVAITVAVLVFLFFPRFATPNMLLRMQVAPQAPLTGFSEHVSFDQVARITQNPEVIAHVTLEQDGKILRPSELYLRGLTLNIYSGNEPSNDGANWQWIRAESNQNSDMPFAEIVHAGTDIAALPPPPPTRTGHSIKQTILLKPTGTSTLFAMAGASAIRMSRDTDVVYFPGDSVLKLVEIPQAAVQYEVFSTGKLPATRPAPAARLTPPSDFTAEFSVHVGRRFGRLHRMFSVDSEQPTSSRIDPKITELARRREVSGQDEAGALAVQRGAGPSPHALDAAIARNIEYYLQSQYSYTLDLTDTTRKRAQDPIVAFLYDFKRGHCEYFAGAMTLLCQSLGMEARMVIGFRAGSEDFNNLGGYFVVKQSHAHAWVEVLTTNGWQSFDPTAATFYAHQRAKGTFANIYDFFDFLQYKWAKNIVSYSSQNRDSIIQEADDRISDTVGGIGGWFKRLHEYFLGSEEGYVVSFRLITAAIILATLVLPLCIGIFLAEKWRLYRRAHRIGISSLPAGDQLRLARQLGFYDDLLTLLNHNNIYRPPHWTPQEFAYSLSWLPADAYEQICRLTAIFYRVRFGEGRITHGQRRHLMLVIARVAQALEQHAGSRV